MIEQLESRRYQSVTIQNHVLRIVGTVGDDQIVVDDLRRFTTLDGKTVHQYGVSGAGKYTDTLSASRVSRIVIDALGGDDDVTIQGQTTEYSNFDPITVKTTIRSGAGNDHVIGGQGRDRIEGGDGDDIIAGDDGADVLIGGAGDNVVLPGAGRDRVFADDAGETTHLYSAESRDRVVGDPDDASVSRAGVLRQDLLSFGGLGGPYIQEKPSQAITRGLFVDTSALPAGTLPSVDDAPPSATVTGQVKLVNTVKGGKYLMLVASSVQV